MVSVRRNVQERAYLYLKDQIVNLRLRADNRLTTIAIAKSLGVSRTPVKEALGRLEQEGLVTRASGWGYAVKGMTLKEARDSYRVREALEVEAARGAVQNLDEEGLDALGSIMSLAEKHWGKRNVREFRKCNRRFHRLIANASRNAVLLNLIDAMDGRVQLLGAMLFEHRLDRGEASLAHNRAILKALRGRNVRAVERAVRARVSEAREQMTHYLMDTDGSH